MPYLHLPFTWLETFLHEISHGVVALLTGGSIDRISLSASGEGRCYYQGGLQWLVTFSGYLGAIFWGMFIYLGASSSVKAAHQFGVGIAIFVIVSGLFWARDGNTWIILVTINLMLFLPLWFVQKKPTQLFIQFVGIYVLVNAIKSLLELLAIKHVGDHVHLQQLTAIPSYIWLVIWLLSSCAVIWYLWHKSSYSKHY